MSVEPELTPVGRARRDQIERMAVRTAVGRRRVRRLGRGVVVVVVAIAAVIVVRPVRHTDRPVVARRDVPRRSVTTPEGIVVTYVRTDPTIVDRLRVDPSTPRRWTTIGDRDLLDGLAAAGQPAGLIHVEGRVLLVTP